MSCGDCTACCEVFRIDELEKPKGVLCTHCDKGCTIYEQRPKVCQDFKCGYLVNDWREELRPDKCGVIINNTKSGYVAIRFRDTVEPVIMEQIQFMQKKYGIQIKGEDARCANG